MHRRPSVQRCFLHYPAPSAAGLQHGLKGAISDRGRMLRSRYDKTVTAIPALFPSFRLPFNPVLSGQGKGSSDHHQGMQSPPRPTALIQAHRLGRLQPGPFHRDHNPLKIVPDRLFRAKEPFVTCLCRIVLSKSLYWTDDSRRSLPNGRCLSPRHIVP